jgi:hypothetical protein
MNKLNERSNSNDDSLGAIVMVVIMFAVFIYGMLSI